MKTKVEMEKSDSGNHAAVCPRCGAITAVAAIAGLLAQTMMAFGESMASPYATGGEVTVTDLGNFKTRYIHVFTNTDEVATFRNVGKKPLSLRYLVVGGGGSGGYASAGTGGKNIPTGGGGGGGGVCEEKDIPFAADTEWSILVGKGAEPVVSQANPGTTAGASSISNGTDKIVVVPGGGNGTRSSTNKSKVVNPTDGAAGGGYSTYALDDVGGEGKYESSIFGEIPEGAPFNGGGKGSKSYTGAGGGGAGSAGMASNNQRAGDGGLGLISDITGEALVYGSGGGGGANLYLGLVGGLGGMRAGNGATYEISGSVTNFIAASAPAVNSGCGGAGGMEAGNNDASTAGADGIVVIRYEVLESPCEGGDVVTRTELRPGKYRYLHVFTNTSAVAQFANRSGRELKLRYLAVGGGGSGGYGSAAMGGGQYYPSGCGGGGGGVCEVKDVSFAAGSEWTVLVGKGAEAVVSVDNPGTAAGASSISNDTDKIVVVDGGGNGCRPGAAKGSTKIVAATDGAAGGGATSYATTPGVGTYASSIFGVSPAGAPFGGGCGANPEYTGGGGGGAGSAGLARTDTKAGDGGEGLGSDITGELLVYGSGGGGGANLYRKRTGGLGGTRAGNGATYEIDGVTTNFIAATTPAANSGCGGAGGMQDGNNDAATAGADGVVIISYDYAEVETGLILLFR